MGIIRSFNRQIVKQSMKRDCMTKVCKHSHITNYDRAGRPGETRVVPSYFAQHWKEYLDKEVK